jgi:hypothetical protein
MILGYGYFSMLAKQQQVTVSQYRKNQSGSNKTPLKPHTAAFSQHAAGSGRARTALLGAQSQSHLSERIVQPRGRLSRASERRLVRILLLHHNNNNKC